MNGNTRPEPWKLKLEIWNLARLLSALLTVSGCGTVPPQTELPPARVGVLPKPTLKKPVPTIALPSVVTKFSFRDIVAIQTLLDRQNFSCNTADGIIGRKTRQALRAWQDVNGLPVTGQLDEATLRLLGPLDSAFTTHTVTSEEATTLTAVPTTWWGKSSVSRLGYETILETIAEKYHSSEEAIRKLNPAARWPNPPVGENLVVPNPFPFKTPQTAMLKILLNEKLIRAVDANGKLVAQFPCSIARDKEKRPAGDLFIVNCAANPTYVLDPAVFVEDPEIQALGKRLVIPAGPNNPVGVAWITLNLPGYGIHGTPRPEDIGKTGSHGCFRLANWNAEKLLRMIRIGMPVMVEK